MVVPKAVYPFSNARVLIESVIKPLVRTIIGIETLIQPRAQKLIQKTFSTILSPTISKSAPSFDEILNFFAKLPF